MTKKTISELVVDYIESRCSKEALESNGILLLDPRVLKEARSIGEGHYVEVIPGVFLTEEEDKANRAYDEWKDMQHGNN